MIEILLVLVIIAVAAGLTMLSLSRNPASIVDREARRLQAVLSDASDEAVVRGVEIALAISSAGKDSKPGYQLLVLDKDALSWKPAEFESANKGIWAAHSTAEDIRLDWVLEGQAISARQMESLAQVAALNAPEGLHPSIILLSSGEMTPFSLRIRHSGIDYEAGLFSDGISGVFLQ